ncbi:MAG: hypothetical protein OEZ58_09400 [Gammaproteobacteria bacterium]|nr:hypothetical protein [Gammaproteobacteria bacterium]
MSIQVLKHKTIAFFVVLAITIASVELLTRLNEASVFSLQENILLKLQMFRLQDKTDILFIGSSRAQDGIEPEVIQHELAQQHSQWKNIKVFNGASPGASLKRLAYVADKALDKPGLKVLGIELSDPQLVNRNWNPSFYSEEPATNVEDFLQKTLAKYSYLVRYRKSFRVNNLLQSPLLIFANYSDGTEWFRRGLITQSWADSETPMDESDRRHWRLHIVKADASQSIGVVENSDAQEVYEAIAEKARQRGVRLFLFVPPLTGVVMQRECSAHHLASYQQFVNLTQAPLIMHACENLRAVFFYPRNRSHLNKIGRTIWSRNLTQILAQEILLTPVEQSNAF